MSTTHIRATSSTPDIPLGVAAEQTAANSSGPYDGLPTPVIDCNAQGIITAINQAGQDLTRTYGINMLGKELWTLTAPEEQQASRESFLALMTQGGEDLPFIRRSIFTSNGGFRTYQIGRLLLRDPEGKPDGLRMVLADVTEHAMAHEREKTSRLWLESISDSLAETVMVTDTLGFIRFANANAVRLTEWEENELLHMTIAKAIPILSYSRAEGIPFNYRLVLERRSSGIITFLTKNKQQATVAFSTAPVLDKHQGSTIGVSYVFRKPDSPL